MATRKLTTASPSWTPGEVSKFIRLHEVVTEPDNNLLAMTQLPKSKVRSVGVSNHTAAHVSPGYTVTS